MKKKFKNLSLDKQIRICERNLSYWQNMRKNLIHVRRAKTENEKDAIKNNTDLDLITLPETEEEE